MKHLKLAYLLFSLFAVTIMTSSCKDYDNITSGNEVPDENLADYTVIMMMNCGNRDVDAINDLSEMIALREEGKIGSNVNVIGCLKPSPSYQIEGQTDACFYFDLKPKQGLSADIVKKLHDFDSKKSSSEEDLKKAWTELPLKYLDIARRCDAKTSVNSSDSIASLIKRAAGIHPAKHYVLLAFGHGYGYDPLYDSAIEGAYDNASSRSFMPDYNMSSNRMISLDEFILGVKKSDVKIQTLFSHNCHMAALENMAAYATQFDHFLGSIETTYGGYFFRFIEKLSQTGDDEARLKDTFKDLVDYYATVQNHDDGVNPTSFGYYDLRKMPALMSVIAEAKDWFVNANKLDTCYMRNVILDTYYSDQQSSAADDSKGIILHPEEHSDQVSVDALSTIIARHLETNEQKEPEYGYVLATMLKASLDNKKYARASLDFDKMQSIYDNYMVILKDMSYINCTKDKTDLPHNPYLYTSPAIQLLNFNENACTCYSSLYDNGIDEDGNEYCDVFAERLYDYYQTKDWDAYNKILSMYLQTNYRNYNYWQAKKNNKKDDMEFYSTNNIATTYCSTQFHKHTGWGDLLKQTTCNPSYNFNPTRH